MEPQQGVSADRQWHATIDNSEAAAGPPPPGSIPTAVLHQRPSSASGGGGGGGDSSVRLSSRGSADELGGRCLAAGAPTAVGIRSGSSGVQSKRSAESADAAERSLAVLTEQLRVSLDLAAGGDGGRQAAAGQLMHCRVDGERRPVHVNGRGAEMASGAVAAEEGRRPAATTLKLERAITPPSHAEALGGWALGGGSPAPDYYQSRHKAEALVMDECPACRRVIRNKTDACAAMGRNYHTRCFTCFACGRTLKGKSFYWLQDKAYCEEDYKYTGFQQMAEHCRACGQLIQDVVLQAIGQPYHPGCFRCQVCNKCLDGESFTVDARGIPLCIGDYHRLYAPTCAACRAAILPMQGTDETVRVVALGNDYHIDCYHCADCGMQLTDEPRQRCYPLGGTLLCRTCHVTRREQHQRSLIGGGSNSSGVESVSGRPNDVAYASDSTA